MKVEIYSDIVCPWCYIGERRFARALAQFEGDVEVVFRPYQLDASAPAQAVPLPQYLASRFGRSAHEMIERVTREAAGEGISMDMPNAQAVNTRTAHRLARLAEREYGAEVQRALVERLFDAHFTRGLDVSDHASLTALAAAVGMDAERVREYLASGEGERETGEELDAARRLGIGAVPTFVIDGQYAVQGAQPTSTFVEVLGEVGRLSTS